MKSKLFTIINALFAMLLLLTSSAFAQSNGDVRSAASGNWSEAATWEVFQGGEWVAASEAPTGGESILIDGHEVTADGVVTVTGHLTIGAAGQLSEGETLTFGDGAVYEHARDGGRIPTATWAEGSTILFTGVTTATAPTNSNQNFYNLTWDNPGHTGNPHLRLNAAVIGGDFVVKNTGASGGRLQLTDAGNAAGGITIEGNLILEGGEVAASGSGAVADYAVAVHGNIHVHSGATFSLSRNNNAKSVWTLGGDLVVESGATIRESSGVADLIGSIVFSGNSVQQLVLDGSVSGIIVYEVASEAIVNLGTTVVGGTSTFSLAAGAELQTASADGVAGNFTTSGTVSLSEGANYTFNGSVAQVTSTALPTTVNNLTIDNAAGVTVSQETTVSNQLILNAGVLDNTVPVNLGESGSVVENGGSLLVPFDGGGGAEGDVYRTIAAGDWSDVSIWEVDVEGEWLAAANAPDGTASVTILHAVTLDENLSVSGDIKIEADGALTLGEEITLTFASGGSYEHAINGGSVPVATWEEGSTILFTGITGNAPNNRNQNFYNVVWNNPGQSSNLHMGWNNTVIGGDLTVLSSGASSRFQLTDASGTGPKLITIMGDINVLGGQVTITGSGGAQQYEVTVHGNVNVAAGTNFSPSRGGGGRGTWILHGDLIATDATFQDSHSDNQSLIRFAGTEPQTVSLSGISYSGTVNFEVATGATVALGSSVIGGNGGFVVNQGSEVQTGHVDGLLGNFATSRNLDFSNAASYTFNGSEAQITSIAMPQQVSRLTIDNAAGVTLTRETTVNAALVLKAGVLDNTIPVTLGAIAELVVDGGSLLFPFSEGIEFSFGDFRAVASGDFSAAASWQVFTAEGWEDATSAPTGSELIYISSDHVITVDGEVSISGTVLVQNDGQITVGTSGSLTFASGSYYQHDRDGGSFPIATWGVGSTVDLTGTKTGSAPGNRNQSFYNLNINTPDLGGNRDFGFNNVTIGGEINVYATGNFRWQLTSVGAGQSREFTIMGDVIVHGGEFATHGSGNANSEVIVNHHGDVVLNAGNFSIARGGQGGSGTTTWNLKGGNFTVNGGTMQNSNAAGAKWVFAGEFSPQAISIAGSADIQGAALSLEVAENAILNLGNTQIGGSGSFSVLAGGEVQTAHASGLAGNIQTTGTVSLNSGANFAFNGTVAQVTSTLLPTELNNLTINNASRVTLSQETQINGTLTLLAGLFDNSIPFTLGENGTVSLLGGRLLISDIDYVAGDVRSKGSGVWSNASNWESFDGTSWTTLSSAPSGSEKIYVWADHTVEVDTDVTMTARLSVVHEGNLTVNETATLTFGQGGQYAHGRNGGTVPTATWGAGSTIFFLGTIDTAPANTNQNFHNIELNTPLLTFNADLGLNGVTIGGNINIRNTGPSNRWHLSSASANESREITIMGNVTHFNGAFSVQGTGNANTHFVVHHYGNIDAQLGNFSISRGSQGGGTGTTVWNLHKGNFLIRNATAQNSNNAGAKWVFTGKEGTTQTLDIRSTAIIQGSGMNMEIKEGAVVNMLGSNVRAGGFFTLEAGAELRTTHVDGLDGNFTTSGAVSLSQQASYGFVGTLPQETSFRMPQTVHNLTISNNSGVFLTRETTINGTLFLNAGIFDNTISFILGPNGKIVENGGFLLFPVSVEEREELPKTFALKQNYPNPFNPTTNISYDIPSDSHVSITIYDVTGRRVAQLVDGQHTPGTYTITWNAQHLASGMYLYRIVAGDFNSVRRLMLVK